MLKLTNIMSVLPFDSTVHLQRKEEAGIDPTFLLTCTVRTWFEYGFHMYHNVIKIDALSNRQYLITLMED